MFKRDKNRKREKNEDILDLNLSREISRTQQLSFAE